MFSSLLSRPKHSPYDPNLHFIPNSNVSSITSKKQPDSITSITDIQTNSSTQSKLDSTIPLKKRYPNLKHNFPNPPRNQQRINETKEVLQALLNSKIGSTTTKKEPEFIETSSTQIIQIEEYKQDPMLPPKHKLRKNRHEKPDQLPQQPILKQQHNVTKEDRAKWNIPASVSNWKNNGGYTIDLTKRMAAFPQQTPEINLKKFEDLNSALTKADIDVRKELQEKMERQQQIENEARLEREKRIKEIAYSARQRSSSRSSGRNESSRRGGYNARLNDDYEYKRRKY
ncbi:PRP45 [Candida jiufengensis]|uniref:PRP45 n=1 Tax=Candida jiufengensis TaxID=497108 RepID=UPI002223F1CC|nr:PRP45 [Candida jiufengensis]KAI5956878.1 PRP45 [Candida jiufengensis]